MHDSYGDGWHGNLFTINGEEFTFDTGYGAQEDLCLEDGCYEVTLDGGPWQNEITWDLGDNSGGAPFYGEVCVGDASTGDMSMTVGSGADTAVSSAAPSDECDGDVYTLYMSDSYGDGWHGNLFTIDGESYTFDSGYGEEADVCL